jgi:polyphosphate kinase 2 (PPK2 family)
MIKKISFSNLNMEQSISNKEYKALIDELQEKARLLSHYASKRKKNIILVFEGWDAAGKGGAIRRLTSKLDPRLYNVISIAAPNEVERKHHYLWRFWSRIPQKGNLTIFDRSWYGRVLVERIEGFAKQEEWNRAYSEIVRFENDLVSGGGIILKYWLHISPEEQLNRFNARKDDPLKRWKLTEEDWRNREKWDIYVQAAEEMFNLTSTSVSEWSLIPANDKYFARVEILRLFCEKLERELDIPKKFR